MRPLTTIQDIRFLNVWNNADVGLQARVKTFWENQQAIPEPAEREKRARQLIMVATDKDENILATSTGLKTRIIRLNNNWLYEYRCFVAAPYRTVGFDLQITNSSMQALEDHARHDSHKPIGAFVLVQNKDLNLKKFNNATVWRGTNMIFLGYNADGFPIRVYYFSGATV